MKAKLTSLFRRHLVLVCAGALSIAGCVTGDISREESGTAIGAGIGAAIGASVSSGDDKVKGALIGALIVVALSSVMNMMGLAIYYQSVVKGIVLVSAIIMHRFFSKRINKL